MRIHLATICLFHFLTSWLLAQDAQSQDAAIEVADAYEALFEQNESLMKEIGEDAYDAILYPDVYDEVQPTEAQRKRLLEAVDSQLDQLEILARAPTVNWGRKNDLIELGPSAMIPEVGSMRRTISQVSWYAKENFNSEPDRALEGLLYGLAASRHVNSEEGGSGLIMNLTQIATENIVIARMAELLPRMSDAQRSSIRVGLEMLPKAENLADALRGEQEAFIGWFRRRIDTGLQTWELENHGPDGFDLAKDLRLAGVVLLAGQPLRISLHNQRRESAFWLEEGKRVNGILLEKVELKDPPRAWIERNGIRAVIDLEAETIQNRYVPWEVLYSAIVLGDGSGVVKTEAQMKEALSEYGLTPENALDQLDLADGFLDQAISKLELPADEFQAWERDFFDKIPENYGLVKLLAPPVGKILEVNQAAEQKYDALKLGLALQEEGDLATVNAETELSGFVRIENEDGFTLTPKEYMGHDREYYYSLHFGTPPEEPDD